MTGILLKNKLKHYSINKGLYNLMTSKLKENEKGIMTMSPQQDDVINKPEPKVRLRVF